MEVKLTILGVILILVFLFLTIRVAITRADARKRKAEIDAEYTQKINDLMQIHDIATQPTDVTVDEVICQCTEVEEMIDLYYRTFVLFVNQHVTRTHTQITNRSLKVMEYDFRQQYNDLLGIAINPPINHYQKLKQMLRARKLMR